MHLSAFFTNLAVPATGLTPTITVYNLTDGTTTASGVAMVEVGGGWYKYNFSTYNASKEYVYKCDGGVGLPVSERYVVGSTDEPNTEKIAEAIFEESMSGYTTPGTAGYALEMIRKIEMGRWKLTNNIMTFYDDNGTTPVVSFSITDKNGEEIELDDGAPAERTPV